ncbi:MAG TPA: hypothetical protein VM658_07025 [bacterium]|nr:hypothetical protein [bacterium]
MTPKKKDDLRMIHVRLDPETHKKLRIKCAEEDKGVQDFIRELIVKAVDRKKGGDK